MFVAVKWRKVGQFGGGDDHTPGVFTHITGDPFELEGHFPDFRRFFVSFQKLADHLFLFVGLTQGHADFKRNHFRQTVGKTIGFALHPGYVTDHRLGRHGAEGDDLGDGVAAISAGHVVDHPVAPFHAEVHIKVGHGYPFRVQKALKQQVVLDWVQIGDFLGIGHQ